MGKSELFDIAKRKLIEIGSEYIRENVEKSKKKIVKYIEVEVERKVRREVRRYVNKAVFYVLLGIGGAFLLYGAVAFGVYALGLPSFAASITFGLLLMTIGALFYLYQ